MKIKGNMHRQRVVVYHIFYVVYHDKVNGIWCQACGLPYPGLFVLFAVVMQYVGTNLDTVCPAFITI